MHRRFAVFAAATAVSALAAPALAQRAVGVDVSDWQGANINWITAAKPVSQGGAGISFAFIRSSRGGTTGTYDEKARTGTLSQRYDDLYVAKNMAGAKAAGVLPGAYHFARPDITTNTGTDEANHFIETGGAYMRPGYLRPVLDLEAGAAERTKTDLTNFALDFSNRLFAVTGVRPIVYISSSYARDEVDSRINTLDLWLARWIDPAVVDIQTVVDPPAASGYANQYGVWNPTYPSYPAVRPWDFWQYSSTRAVAGIGNPVDQDVANGDIEFVKDFLVPAIWTSDASGSWSNAANWNSETYLPSANDRVIINRSTANPGVGFGSITASVRSLQLNEQMAFASGSLTVAQYANLDAPLTVNTGTFKAGSIDNNSALSQNNGVIITGAVTGSGTINLGNGTFTATSIRQSSVTISYGRLDLLGTGTSVVGSLDITGTGVTKGRIDLGLTKLIIDYPSTATSGLGMIRQTIADGGIITTDPTPGVGVAYFLASDLFESFPAMFGGVTIDASSILLTRALRGDTDLSGTVDFADLVTLAQSYNGSGRWRNGDFNHNGSIDFSDLVSLAQNYNAGTAAAVGIQGASASFMADWALAQSLVPEPTLAFLTGVTLMPLRRRR